MKKIITLVIAASFLCTGGGISWAANARSVQRQYRKNVLPPTWKYEAGYTLWRLERGMAANWHTYKRYQNDRAWRSNLHRYRRPEEIVLNTLDWTAEEIALFWRSYRDLFKIYPAGTEEIRR